MDNAQKKQPAVRSTASSEKSPLTTRKLWLFRLSAMLLVPGLVFAVLEVTLRLAGYGYDTNFFVKRDIEGKPFLVQNEEFSRRFFPPESLRQPNALRMHATKSPGTIRIFVLGESAAMGDPEPAFGPARFLEVLLQERYPNVKFEIVNVSFTAINSHVLLPIARECAEHDGDLWIIYMGNNEMVGPFGAATVLGLQAPPRLYVQAVAAIQRTRVGQLAMDVVRKIQKPANKSGSWGGMAMFEKQRLAPKSPKREAVLENFKANLDDMLRSGVDSGARIILNTVAVNLHDSPPFASLHDEVLTETNRAHFDQLFQSALRSQSAKDWTNAAAGFDAALKLDGNFAEAHYRRALCLEQIGQQDAARKHFQLACDTDALPFRTDSRENELIHKLAQPFAKERLQLVDAPSAMAQGLSAGVCGQESFHEHVHFNFDGGYRLGLIWAQAVEQMLPTKLSRHSTNEWATQFLCEKQLGLTDVGRKLVLQSVMQRLQNPPLNSQFNNAERLNRLATYSRFLLSNMNEHSVTNARAELNAAVAKRPDDHHVLEQRAVFVQSFGDLNSALQDWRSVGELFPHDFLPSLQVGMILARQSNLVESEKHLRQAIALRPSLVEAWSQLGQCLGARGDWTAALAAFDQAIKLKPEESAFWAFRAKVLSELKRTAEAIECYRKAVELNPNYAEAHAALGDQYSMTGKTAEAMAEYEAAIKAKPDYAMALSNLGVMLLRQGRLDEASIRFRQTLAIEPGNEVAKDFIRQIRSQQKEQKR